MCLDNGDDDDKQGDGDGGDDDDKQDGDDGGVTFLLTQGNITKQLTSMRRRGNITDLHHDDNPLLPLPLPLPLSAHNTFSFGLALLLLPWIPL